jgi:hypothetical protein
MHAGTVSPILLFSPRRRGWSHQPDRLSPQGPVLPAQAGVVQLPSTADAPGHRSPPRRRGGPIERAVAHLEGDLPPRRRGWPLHPALSCVSAGVLPAQAGVVPYRGTPERVRHPCPSRSVRGDPVRSSRTATRAIDAIKRNTPTVIRCAGSTDQVLEVCTRSRPRTWTRRCGRRPRPTRARRRLPRLISSSAMKHCAASKAAVGRSPSSRALRSRPTSGCTCKRRLPQGLLHHADIHR